MNGSALLAILVIVVVLPGLLGWILSSHSRMKGSFGPGALEVACPRCQKPQPIFRKPASLRQAMWGGYTCKSCGSEIDRYGGAQQA